jgi:SagB-type dehydrogenase family enzyme
MKILLSLFLVAWFCLANLVPGLGAEAIKLPPPAMQGKMSVEAALQGRRTNRQFVDRSLDLAQVSQLLWAADGINNPQGKRTAPAARAAYAIDLYMVAGNRGVTNLAPGIYRYLVADNALEPVAKGEFRAAVAKACNSQAWMEKAPVIVAITGDFARCAAKNGEQKAHMYTYMESGFVAQNLFLQVGALGLGAGIVGGFNEKALAAALKLPPKDTPLLVMPVGYKP